MGLTNILGIDFFGLGDTTDKSWNLKGASLSKTGSDNKLKVRKKSKECLQVVWVIIFGETTYKAGFIYRFPESQTLNP